MNPRWGRREERPHNTGSKLKNPGATGPSIHGKRLAGQHGLIWQREVGEQRLEAGPGRGRGRKPRKKIQKFISESRGKRKVSTSRGEKSKARVG